MSKGEIMVLDHGSSGSESVGVGHVVRWPELW